MPNDAMQTLQEAGIPLTTISEAERAVIAALSPDEVQTLISIRKRLSPGDDDTGRFALSLSPTSSLGSLSGTQLGSLSLVPRVGSEGTARVAPSVADGTVTGWVLF